VRWSAAAPRPHRRTAAELIGADLCARIERTALALYTSAASYALTRGLILADTKFEFGLADGALVLIDEALTPDSSRYWPAAGYAPGGPQPSFDKQFVRDWLVAAGFRKGLERGPDGAQDGWTIPPDIVAGTQARYAEARDMLMRDA
jgi:phosphoribosylaminoimidazole-succinocarboxamide synthase